MAAKGAKSKFTQATIDAITQAIELGATYRRACAAAGISEETFSQWRQHKSGFSEAIEKAEAVFVEKHLKVIQAAGTTDGTWQASAWMLERRYPSEYGKQVQEHQGAISVNVRYTNDWRGGGNNAGDA